MILKLNHWYKIKYGRLLLEGMFVNYDTNSYWPYTFLCFPCQGFNIYNDSFLWNTVKVLGAIKQQYKIFRFFLSEIIEEIPAPYDI